MTEAQRDVERGEATAGWPPNGLHPRVLVVPQHVGTIQRNLTDRVVAPRYAVLRASAELDTDGRVPDGRYDTAIVSAIEANAFLHLVHGDIDDDAGRRAVSQLRNYLDTIVPVDPRTANIHEIRRTGDTLLLAAMKDLAGHQEVGTRRPS